MPRQTTTEPEPRADPPGYLEQFASYDDGNDLIVFDRKSPSSWIRSDVTVAIEA